MDLNNEQNLIDYKSIFKKSENVTDEEQLIKDQKDCPTYDSDKEYPEEYIYDYR